MEMQYQCPHTPVLLVGTKMDLREDPEIVKRLSEKNQLPITTEQGLEKAKQMNAIGYVETSALEGTNMYKIYEIGINHVLEHFDGNSFTDQAHSKKCIVM